MSLFELTASSPKMIPPPPPPPRLALLPPISPATLIELSSGELGIDEGILLKRKADFGSTRDNCVILGASSVSQTANSNEFSGACTVNNDNNGNNIGAENDNGSIPESLSFGLDIFANGGCGGSGCCRNGG
ncbi:unnamed protein product [Fraxinus pennsylvanica]|uniref:Uncharacterized protein n=1 Tax=Fraxinus pennsylvanica TaxID=56036 RepID=A0AAD2EAJ7_9LAMI|nr:unnamed protein product [Fraxinus pennsylvanica]